ncbi:hypothetical protein BH18THE1_BH18THE1_08320 [soil metagenome]
MGITVNPYKFKKENNEVWNPHELLIAVLIIIDFDTYLTYVALENMMSDRNENENNEDIETAQKNQKKIGAAENDPKTTGPAENLREEAAETVDEDEDSNEPA